MCRAGDWHLYSHNKYWLLLSEYRPNISQSDIRCSFLPDFIPTLKLQVHFFLFCLTFLSQNFWVSFLTLLWTSRIETGLIPTVLRSFGGDIICIHFFAPNNKNVFSFHFSFPISHILYLFFPAKYPMIFMVSVHQTSNGRMGHLVTNSSRAEITGLARFFPISTPDYTGEVWASVLCSLLSDLVKKKKKICQKKPAEIHMTLGIIEDVNAFQSV